MPCLVGHKPRRFPDDLLSQDGRISLSTVALSRAATLSKSDFITISASHVVKCDNPLQRYLPPDMRFTRYLSHDPPLLVVSVTLT